MAKFILMLFVQVLISAMTIFDSDQKESAAQACGISFSKIGCFADKRRPFPKLLMTQRNSIDWKNWSDFLERLVCDCANKTATAGYSYFGIQFWAECWAGENPDVAYSADGQSDSCVDGDFLPCDSNAASGCAGMERVNYVYEIKMGQSSDACQDLDPLQCENYREFCDSYGHIAKTCPRTCNLCHG